MYKIFTLSVFSFIILSVASCDQSAKPEIDQANEAETLKNIAIQENFDFYKKDFKTWSNYFMHSEKLYWTCVEDNFTLRATGWKDLSQFVSTYMKENPVPDSDSLLKKDVVEDFQSEIGDKLAVVRYKKNHMMPDGKFKILLESRVFQKDGDQWKIICMTSAPGYATPKSSSNIFMHNRRTINLVFTYLIC